MTPLEAAELLQLSEHATTEARATSYDNLRRQLEDKLAKAPTPGLRDKYRSNLKLLEEAYALLNQQGDHSDLPSVQRGTAPAIRPSPNPTATPSLSNTTPAKKSASLREPIIVAVVALALLSAGGWWVVKIREDSTNRQRSEDAARAGQAAAAKAEQARMDHLQATTRTKLAELKVNAEAVDQEVRAVERKLSELRSDANTVANQTKGNESIELLELKAKLSAHEEFLNWIVPFLARHSSKIFRLQAEEMLNAHQIDDAARITSQAVEEFAKLEQEIATSRRQILATTGEVRVTSKPEGLTYRLIDRYGRKRSGKTPEMLRDIPAGKVEVSVSCPGFPDKSTVVTLGRSEKAEPNLEFIPAKVIFTSSVANTHARLKDKEQEYTAPATFELPPGQHDVYYWVPSDKPGDSQDISTTLYEKGAYILDLHEGEQLDFSLAPRLLGQVHLVSEPEGADIRAFTGGNIIGRAIPAFSQGFPEGNFVCALELPGYFTEEVSVPVTWGKEVNRKVVLSRDDGTKVLSLGIVLAANDTAEQAKSIFAQLSKAQAAGKIGAEALERLKPQINAHDGKVYVVYIRPGGPAENSGLQVGMVIDGYCEMDFAHPPPEKARGVVPVIPLSGVKGLRDLVTLIRRGPLGREVILSHGANISPITRQLLPKPPSGPLQLNEADSPPVCVKYVAANILSQYVKAVQGDQKDLAANLLIAFRKAGQANQLAPAKVDLTVTETGEAIDIVIVQLPEESLRQAVLDAVKQWKFTAGRKDGQPAAVRIQMAVNFSSR